MAKDEIILSATDRTKAAFDSVHRGLGGLHSGFAALAGAAAVVAGAGGLGLMIKSSLETGDALAKTADRLGVTTQALAALRHGASLSGSSAEGMDKALTKLARSLSDAAQGSGVAAKELEGLGLDAGKLKDLPVDQAMAEIADALKGVDNAADKTRITMNLMGKSSAEMINVMAGGRDGFADMKAEAQALGIALDRVSAAKIEGAGDEIERVQAVAKGMADRFTAELSPAISAVASLIKDAAVEGGGFQGVIELAVEIGVDALGLLADTWRGLTIVVKGVEWAVKQGMAASAATIDGFVNGTIALLNKIPGVNITPVNTLSEWSKIAAGEVLEVEAELRRLATEGLPSDEIAKRIAEFKAQALDVAANAPKAATIEPGDMSGHALSDEKAEKEAAQERERLAAKLETIRASNLTEQEALLEARDAKLAILQEGRDADLIAESDYKAQIELIQQGHEKKMLEFGAAALKKKQMLESAAQAGQIAGALGAFAALGAAAGKHNKEMFMAVKAARISQAVVDTYAGAANALATVPYPFNFVAAAAVVAAGLANVATISSTGFGSSGGGGGGGGSAPAMAGGGGGGRVPTQSAEPPSLGNIPGGATPPLRAPTQITLNLGDEALLNGLGLRKLIDKISEAHADGYTLRIAGGTA